MRVTVSVRGFGDNRRHVEYVGIQRFVHETEHTERGTAARAQRPPLGVRRLPKFLVEQHLDVSENGGKGRTEFLGKGGKDVGLELAHLAELAVQPLEILVRKARDLEKVFAVGDVVGDAHKIAFLVQHIRPNGEIHGPFGPVGTH